MDKKIIGVFYNPWQSEYDPSKSILELYRRGVWIKANPRNESYMKALFLERYPQGQFINTADHSWQEQLACADTVVLLYPDSIGLYFGPLESIVKNNRKTWASVRVLNGRRRDFLWNMQVRRRLRLRRFFERTMLGELLATAIFVMLTPVFVICDLVRGRR